MALVNTERVSAKAHIIKANLSYVGPKNILFAGVCALFSPKISLRAGLVEGLIGQPSPRPRKQRASPADSHLMYNVNGVEFWIFCFLPSPRP